VTTATRRTLGKLNPADTQHGELDKFGGGATTPVPPGCPEISLETLPDRDDVADIVRRYEAGETTQQIGNRYGISKTRVATVLHEQGVAIRRQVLDEEQVSDAAMLYAAGCSLGWLAAQYGISPRQSPKRCNAMA
jgi:DNA-binding CsgD family transcriptional regulator